MTRSADDGVTREELARENLANQLQGNPYVSMVDIGLHGTPPARVLRVHVREGISLEIPETLDGVPVVVVRGEYFPE